MNRQEILFAILVVLAAFFFGFVNGCAGTQHKRELLQQQYPECHVWEDLTLDCPDPFAIDTSSGFGTTVQTKKPKLKPTTKRKGNEHVQPNEHSD